MVEKNLFQAERELQIHGRHYDTRAEHHKRLISLTLMLRPPGTGFNFLMKQWAFEFIFVSPELGQPEKNAGGLQQMKWNSSETFTLEGARESFAWEYQATI